MTDRLAVVRTCRVCGGPAVRALPDGYYCAQLTCLELRTWGLRLDLQTLAPNRWCAPARCYCGWFTCHAFASYLVTRPAPELWRPETVRPGWLIPEGEPGYDLQQRALRAARETPLPESHADLLAAAWAERGDVWEDKL